MDIAERLQGVAMMTGGRLSADDRRIIAEVALLARDIINGLRPDAERYMWLRKHLVNWCPDDHTARLSWSAREVLDAEIDAAMKGANT